MCPDSLWHTGEKSEALVYSSNSASFISNWNILQHKLNPDTVKDQAVFS